MQEPWKKLAKRVVPESLRPGALVRSWVRRKTGNVVTGGPFEGMAFIERSVWGAHTPKLLGTYEKELHAIFESLSHREFSHAVDIGGAEGFYAAGLLRMFSDLRLTVFEMLPEGRDLIHRMAILNDVADRLQILGECTPERLRTVVRSGESTFILCDVEGYERELLNPDHISELQTAFILVEVHDHKASGTTRTLRGRFQETHFIERIAQEPRTLGDYPLSGALRRLSPWAIRRYALNEFRHPETAWLWMVPRDCGA